MKTIMGETLTAALIVFAPIWLTWGYYWVTGLQMRF